MRWALIIVAIVVLIVLVVVGIGYTLPVAHTAHRSVTLRASAPAVWATITDVSAYPEWRTDVESVEVLAPVDSRQVWRETGKDGAITFAMVTVDPPKRLVTRITDRDLPFGGEWEYEITPDSAGTRVAITERGEVYNPLFRFVSRFVMGHTATIDSYLRALGAKFGESVTPVTQRAGRALPVADAASPTVRGQ